MLMEDICFAHFVYAKLVIRKFTSTFQTRVHLGLLESVRSNGLDPNNWPLTADQFADLTASIGGIARQLQTAAPPPPVPPPAHSGLTGRSNNVI